MRKVLLFLLFFGAGLTVLWFFRSQRESARPPSPERAPSSAKHEPVTEFSAGKKSVEGRPVGVVLHGAFDGTKFSGEGDTRHRLYVIHSDDVEPLGNDVYDLHQLKVDVYTPETDTLRAHLASPVSRVRITLRNGQPEIGENDRVFLTDAEVTLREGAPVVPLVLHVPLLEWQVSSGRFTSNDHVRLQGTGLEAEGTGLDLDTRTSVLTLRNEGIIDLTLSPESGATLAATKSGPIVIRKIAEPNAEPEVDIVASDGARLAFSDVPATPANAAKEQRIQVNARTIHMRGHAGVKSDKQFDVTAADAEGDVVADGPDEKMQADRAAFAIGADNRLQSAQFTGSVAMHRGDEAFWSDAAQFVFAPSGEISRADLQGHVDLDRAGDRFHSQSAVFLFGPQGQLAHAELSGEPNGTVKIADYLPADTSPGAARELAGAHATIRGAGPLALEFAQGTKLDLPGPGEIEIPELRFVLKAQRSVRGEFDAERKNGRLFADGAAHVDYEESDLDSDALEMRYALLSRGEEIVDLFTNGWTTAHVATPGRGKIAIEAIDGLEMQSKDRRVTVPIARGATITAPDPQGFEARADLMRDVDWEAQSFEALGHVIFEDAQGSGSAAVATAHGRDDLALFGTPTEPARYRLWREPRSERVPGASVEGHDVHLRGQVIDSSGDSRAFVEAADKTYRIESERLKIELFPPRDLVGMPTRPFHALAEEHVRAYFTSEGEDSALICNKLTVDGVMRSLRKEAQALEVVSSDVRAEGDVKFDYNAAGGWSGDGDLLTLDNRKHGRLSTGAGRRVHALWRGKDSSFPYALEADWIDFDREHIEASQVEIKAQDESARNALLKPGPALLEMRADHLEADDRHVLLSGRAHARGGTSQRDIWTIDAGSIRAIGDWRNKKPLTLRDLESVEAWEGFTAELGTRVRARGDRLVADPHRARMEGAPARLSTPVFECRSAWIECAIDTMLISTASGEIGPSPESKDQSWSITYDSLRPHEQPDDTIMALHNPVMRDGEWETRAEWLLCWIDRDEWQKTGELVMGKRKKGELHINEPEAPPPAESKPAKTKGHNRLKDRFEHLRSRPFGHVLSEAYIEGNVEAFRAGERMARASAVYLDLKESRGWLQDADMFIDVNIRDQHQRLRAMAKWMRIQTDFSLRADKASITACDFAVPDYVVETGDLELTPGESSDSSHRQFWDVSAHDNWLRFGGGLAIPLPPLALPTNSKGQPLVDQIVLGQSSQFGTSIRAAFNVPLGSVGLGLGHVFGKIFSLPETDLDGHWKFDAGVLGARGVLLGAGVVYTSKDKFRLEMEFSGIPDTHADKGLVRVPTDERNTLRDWFRLRSRYNFDKNEWLDFAISVQSDPGVQAEFYEHDYLYYEQKDNYVHWRKADDQYYFDASAKVLLEDRTDTAELPKLGAFRGRTPIGELWSVPVLYRAYADAAYLQRQNGNPEFYLPFPDGLGDRDVARIDTEHRLEMPFALGFGGLRATPFAAVRGTVWSEDQDGAQAAGRAGLLGGIDLSTTYWRRFSNGYINTISPTLSFHGDVASTESEPPPVHFDQTEDSIQGKFVDLDLRTRIWKPTTQKQLDLEVRTTYGTDVGPGLSEGLQPILVLGEFLTQVGEWPVAVTQDARYDVRGGHTQYSNTALGFEPHPKLDIETGYHRGDNPDNSVLFEAVSVGARYKLSPKWELQFDQWFALSENTGTSHDVVIRRIGHDFVLDLGVNYHEGQGAGVGFRFTPRFSWKRPSMGLMDRYFGVNR